MAFRDGIYLSATFDDDDAIKTSFATSTDPVVINATAFNGAVGAAWFRDVGDAVEERIVTLSASDSANVYDTDTVVIIGGQDKTGKTIEDGLQPTSSGGNFRLSTSKPFARVSFVSIPGQKLATGTWKVGLGDLVFDPPIARIVAVTAGTYRVRTLAGRDRDIAMAAAEVQDLLCSRVRRTHAVFPCTFYQRES